MPPTELASSPGLLDIQINGAYGFDFSIYEDDQKYIDGLRKVATRIVETGVTRYVEAFSSNSPTLTSCNKTSLLPTIIVSAISCYYSADAWSGPMLR